MKDQIANTGRKVLALSAAHPVQVPSTTDGLSGLSPCKHCLGWSEHGARSKPSDQLCDPLKEQQQVILQYGRRKTNPTCLLLFLKSILIVLGHTRQCSGLFPRSAKNHSVQDQGGPCGAESRLWNAKQVLCPLYSLRPKHLFLRGGGELHPEVIKGYSWLC